ncbi:MAG: hypothetical protein JSS65_11025 [Armatimonadetes bacterium]|nr:hypothetical protein [Armatimonadota bacterium]
MWVAATTLLIASLQDNPKPTPVDRSGEGYLAKLLDSYSKLPPFYLWFDRYSRDTDSSGFEKSGTAQLWYGGGKKFRLYSMGQFGDGMLNVCDGDTWLRDPLDLSQPVELDAAPKTWQAMYPQASPNQNGCLIFWLMDGKASLNDLAEKDKPITMLRKGNAMVVSFTNKSVGKIQIEIVEGWLSASEFVSSFDFDGTHFEFISRDEYKPFVFGSRFDRGTFDVTPGKGVRIQDLRKKKPATSGLAARAGVAGSDH